MTSIPRNVVRDLLPVYLAGDASAETCEIVEYHLAVDPELRDLVDSMDAAAVPSPRWAGLEAAELRAVDETTRLLNRKVLLSTASFSLTSVAMAMGLERTHVLVATLLYVASIVGWVLFLRVCGRLATTGLEPPKSFAVNSLWSGIGGYVGHTAYHLFLSWAGYPPGDWSSWGWLGLAMTFAGWALAWHLAPARRVRSLNLSIPL